MSIKQLIEKQIKTLYSAIEYWEKLNLAGQISMSTLHARTQETKKEITAWEKQLSDLQ